MNNEKLEQLIEIAAEEYGGKEALQSFLGEDVPNEEFLDYIRYCKNCKRSSYRNKQGFETLKKMKSQIKTEGKLSHVLFRKDVDNVTKMPYVRRDEYSGGEQCLQLDTWYGTFYVFNDGTIFDKLPGEI